MWRSLLLTSIEEAEQTGRLIELSLAVVVLTLNLLAEDCPGVNPLWPWGLRLSHRSILRSRPTRERRYGTCMAHGGS